MVRKYSYSTRRRIGGLLLRGLLMLLIGVICGWLLGNLVAESRLGNTPTDPLPFSQMSANPDAAATPAISVAPCLGCPDSYGVAAQIPANRAHRMNDAFRALGTDDPDAALSPADDDGYQYGGRFPDTPAQESAPALSERPDRLPDASRDKTDRGASTPASAPDLSAEAL